MSDLTAKSGLESKRCHSVTELARRGEQAGQLVPRSRYSKAAPALLVVILVWAVTGTGLASAGPTMPALPSLIPTQVTGYKPVPLGVDGTGPIDLANAVQGDGQPGALTALRGDRFEQGFKREWHVGSSRQYVYLYRFAGRAGAAAYMARVVGQMRQMRSQKGWRVALFSLPQVPGSSGVNATSKSTRLADTVRILLFSSGTYLAEVGGRGPLSTPGLTDSLAVLQFRRLAKPPSR